MFLMTLKTSRRAWAGLAVAALFTGLAGVSALPAVAEPAGDVAPAITNLFDGSEIHDVPTIDGTGTLGSTATVADGTGAAICSALIDEFGQFSCTGTQRLTAGYHELSVTSTAPGGAVTVGNTVKIQAVYYPNLSHPEPGALISSEQVFSGQALPEAQVELKSASGEPVCSTVAEEWGYFECDATVPFPAGPLSLTPSMTTTEGAVVVGDSVTWMVIAAPVITSPTEGSVVSNMPTFAGTGFPGADISILNAYSGAVLCSSKVAADGTFSCALTQPFLGSVLAVIPMLSVDGGSAVMGQRVDFTLQSTTVTPIPSPVPTITIPPVPETSAPETTVASAPTVAQTSPATASPATASPATAKSTAAAQQLAATGASGTIWLAVVGGALLLLGGASLLARFRRRTHG